MSTRSLSKIIMAPSTVGIHNFVSSKLTNRLYYLRLIMSLWTSKVWFSWIYYFFIILTDGFIKTSLSGGNILWPLWGLAKSIEWRNTSPLLRSFRNLFLYEISPTLSLWLGSCLNFLNGKEWLLNLSTSDSSYRRRIPINNTIYLDFPIYPYYVSRLYYNLLFFL